MQNSIKINFLIILLLSVSHLFGQYSPGHSAIEYASTTTPGLSIKNSNSGLVDASLISIFNDQNIRLNLGVSSSANLLFGNNRTYIHAIGPAPLDFYTGGARRMILDKDGRLGINTMPGFGSQLRVRGNSSSSDTVALVEVTVTDLEDVVAFAATSTPDGIESNWGIGAVFTGGYRGVRAFTEVGIALEGNAKTGNGVKGTATTGSGILGTSTTGAGVKGTSDWVGVEGTSVAGTAVQGSSTSGLGVYGSSSTKHGVSGRSSGDSTAGVFGRGDFGLRGFGDVAGVYGVSDIGHGVIGQAQGGLQGNEKWDFYANGPARDWGSSSSRRWKNNIQNISNPLEKIVALRGVSYDWDQEHGGGRHDIGFIAEEVGEILPELVTYEENGIDAIALDYTKISALIVEAFNTFRKLHHQEIRQLKEEIKSLKGLLKDSIN